LRWLVDGMNLIGSRPDGWWADRPAAMRRLVEELGEYARRTGEELTVVFDGRERELPRPAGVEVAFATRPGPNAADDEIAERVAAAPDPSVLRVVTSDRDLAERVRRSGAEVVPVSRFRRMLDAEP
jgi:predicted RNA-binding protein with PIN domain